MGPNWKKKPWRSKKYKKWISEQDCCIKERPGPNDPHHENEEGQGTMGGKAGDERLVPLSHEIHVEMEIPGMSRKAVWEKYGVDPEQIIQGLHDRWEELTGKRPGW